jgi:predicted permease
VASRASPADSEDEGDENTAFLPKKTLFTAGSPLDGNHQINDDDNIITFPRIRNTDESETSEGLQGARNRTKQAIRTAITTCNANVANGLMRLYQSLPRPFQSTLSVLRRLARKASASLWDFMNPPLWAMLFAVIVASVPALQRLFFEEGSFVKNSVSSAIKSSGGVAVPLILVVLGANLARNTQKRGSNLDPEEEQIGRKLLIASLLCRMVLPTLIMAPFLAVMAKYVPVSILDDPIFVIVCFLLTGAPSALQLAQICQINDVYENVMSMILFQSYVIWSVVSSSFRAWLVLSLIM